MFGYIKPYVPLLTVAEYEAYKAVYCGLCKEMGRVTGHISRLTLSYDFALLAFLRMTVQKIPTEFDKGACIAHPFKKRLYAKTNDALIFCAGATSILAAGKTRDDIADEKGAKKLAAKAIYPVQKKNVSRLDKDLAALSENISKHLSRLSEIEREKTSSIDIPSDAFGALLSDICAFGYTGETERIVREFGMRLGKIIYVLDAADDIAEDIKGEKYNPIALVYEDPIIEKSNAYPEEACKSSKNKKDVFVLRSDIADGLMTAIGLELSRAKAAFSLIDTEGCGIYTNIILNTLDYGIKTEAKRIFSGKGKGENPLKHST